MKRLEESPQRENRHYDVAEVHESYLDSAFRSTRTMNAAFGCYGRDDESFIFCGNICAKINYAPGTTNDKILEGPKTIGEMFPFFEGTKFEGGLDVAFESSVPNEVYIFNGGEYALVDYIQRKLIAISPIVDGFKCLQNTIFDRDIGAAFASHNSQEAYLSHMCFCILLLAKPKTI
ncbi:hemopexin fold protein [Tanacetum coccineum]